MLNCRDVVELASDHLERKLAGATGFTFRLHVLICGNCRRYIEQLRRTIALLGGLPREPVPLDAERNLIEAFRKARKAAGPPEH